MKTMMKKSMNRKQWITRVSSALLIGWMFAVITVSVSAADGVSTEAGPEGPAQTVYAPANGPGPIIMVLSGTAGPGSYQSYAAELAKLGYYTVLLDGNDILNPAHTGEADLRKAINRAQSSPSAVKGKAAVIGFSKGGGGALYNGAVQPDLVSMVAAYYPMTSTWSKNIDSLVKRFKVPVLMMPGGLDRYKSCCLVETARAIETAAKASGAKFELVVYPHANHGFNLQTGASGEPMGAYRRDDDRDAWRRTVEMLKQYQPLK
jgi:hypothetical protein